MGGVHDECPAFAAFHQRIDERCYKGTEKPDGRVAAEEDEDDRLYQQESQQRDMARIAEELHA
jgi:hypothetical protein